MRISKTCYFIVSLLFLCSGCLLHLDPPTGDQLPGTWRLSDVTSSITGSGNNESFEEQSKEKQLVKDGMVISFFEDKSFTQLSKEGLYVTGQWEYKKDNNTLLLLEPGKPKAAHHIKTEKNKFGKQEMKINVTDRNVELDFIKEGSVMKDYKSDPFYPDNNLWRIKPTRHESNSELTDRFAAYLKQVGLVLKAAKERDQDIVSFEFSQGPIKIYNGGIGINPYSIVPQSWKACFYDDSNALRAFNIYFDYLKMDSFHGAGSGNWVEDDYNILLSIYAGLKEKENGKEFLR
jgi:hypothetical protein